MNRQNLHFFLVVPILISSFSAETRAGLITNLSVSVNPTGGGLEAYDYTLANSTQSTVSVYLFALSVDGGANLQSIGSPTGWDVTYNVGDTSIAWSAPTPDAAIAPGSSASFSFISVEPPVLGDYQTIGFDPNSFQFYDNPGTTSVPGISSVPEPSTVILFGIGSLALIGYYRGDGKAVARWKGRTERDVARRRERGRDWTERGRS